MGIKGWRRDSLLRREFYLRENVIREHADVAELKPNFFNDGDTASLEAIMRPFLSDGPLIYWDSLSDVAESNEDPRQLLKKPYNDAIEGMTQLLEEYYGVEYPLPRHQWRSDNVYF